MNYIPQFEPWLGKEELVQLTECIENNWITGGKKVEQFESRIAELFGVKHAVACCNGTLALWLGLQALGIDRGDEVIVPDFTFIASANSVMLSNATPVFVDVSKDTFNLDPSLIEDAITPRTKAIMPVHIFGQSANMTEIMRIARKHNLVVIEDAAQGIGVTWKGKTVGSFGEVGCISFYADKTLTTGEGGIVLTDSDEIRKKCLILKHQGRTGRGIYVHEYIGYNFRLTDLQAAVGLAQLDKLPEIIRYKKRSEALYKKLLEGIVEFPFVDNNCYNVPFRINILVSNPGELKRYLESNGIGSRGFFFPLHMQPCYSKLNQVRPNAFPGASYAYEHGLSLPSSAMLTEEQIKYICNTIRRFYADN